MVDPLNLPALVLLHILLVAAHAVVRFTVGREGKGNEIIWFALVCELNNERTTLAPVSSASRLQSQVLEVGLRRRHDGREQ